MIPSPSLFDMILGAFIFVGLPFGAVCFLAAYLVWG